jgi:hypothetical protein
VNDQYRIDVLNAAGVRVAMLDDASFTYTKEVNGPGLLVLDLPADDLAVAKFALKGEVLVYRRLPDDGVDWYLDFAGPFLGFTFAKQADGLETFQARCPGINWHLGRRYVLFAAESANLTKFDAVTAEYAMKRLVNYNAAASATVVNGRKRAGALTGCTFTVQADGGAGNTISLACAWQNLLSVLQDIAAIGGGDFDLVRTAALTYQFRWYTGQLGTDRSATVLFDVLRGNLATPAYSYDLAGWKNVVLTAGQDSGAARATRVRQSADYDAAFDVEGYADGRQSSTDAALDSDGDDYLFAHRPTQEFRFTLTQSPSSLYGVHYFLGDLVSIRYRTALLVQKITAVTISKSGGASSVDIETSTV